MNNIYHSLLVETGVIEEAKFDALQQICTEKSLDFLKFIVSQGLVTEEELISSINSHYKCLNLREDNVVSTFYEFDRSRTNLNLNFLEERSCYYIGEDINGTSHFVTTSIGDMTMVNYLMNVASNFSLSFTTGKVLRELANLVNAEASLKGSEENLDTNVDNLTEDAPLVSLLNSIVSKSVILGASDIHIEPYKGVCRIRVRIDGVLVDLESLPYKFYSPLISRVKIWGGMDIAEKRRPQDGKIETTAAGKNLDIRASTLPTSEGESAVLRLLLKDSLSFDLDDMGLDSATLELIKKDLKQTAGVVLLTGPTGSGKTTTLYSFLSRLNQSESKIITLEDPVEYKLDGVNQIQVNSDIGFTFSAGLRSILRQDPDVIMVGEIRDIETAEIAIQCSLTGHLVLSTVHTNDAPSAYTRLIDLGVDNFLINAGVISIVAQRLVRKVCKDCSVEKSLSDIDGLDNEISNWFSTEGITKVKVSQGCESCAQTGYRGRMAIIEYLPNDKFIQSLDKNEYFTAKAADYMREKGFPTLLSNGLQKVALGLTTIEEVQRVVGA